MHSPVSRRALAIGVLAVACVCDQDRGIPYVMLVITGGVLLLAVSVDSISRRGRESAGRA